MSQTVVIPGDTFQTLMQKADAEGMSVQEWLVHEARKIEEEELARKKEKELARKYESIDDFLADRIGKVLRRFEKHPLIHQRRKEVRT